MLWIAVAAAPFSIPLMIGAPGGDIRTVFSNDDFPDYLLRGPAASRTVYTRTTVLPDGAIQNCTVDVSSGDRALDSYTCGVNSEARKAASGDVDGRLASLWRDQAADQLVGGRLADL